MVARKCQRTNKLQHNNFFHDTTLFPTTIFLTTTYNLYNNLKTSQHNTMLAAFFKSFRKGFVVCRGLDVNLSGKVAKKTTLTRKSGRHAHNVFLP